jgi:hypothetical protein
VIDHEKFRKFTNLFKFEICNFKEKQNILKMDSLKIYFVIVCCVIFFIIGSIGNIISIKIFFTKEFISQPTTNYLIASAIVNLVSLLHLPVIVLPDIWTVSNLACQICGGFMLFLVEVQSWVYALSSADRAITTMFPRRFIFKNKLFFQIVIMFSCSLILCLSILPHIIFYEKAIISNKTVCSFLEGPNYSWIFIYTKIQFVLFRTVLPFIITIIASILTIRALCVSKRRIHTNVQNHEKEYQFAKSLILMDFLFIAFRLPTVINFVFNDNILFIYDFLYSFFGLLGALHNVFLFLIFILFNKIYRNLFLKIVSFHRRNSAPQNPIIIMTDLRHQQ